MSHVFRPGDRVSFRGKRGKTVTGTINRVRTRERRGRAKALALAVTGDAHSLDTTVAEIAPDGGGGVWTVGLGNLTYLGEGDRNAAAAAVNTVKAKRRNNLEKRATARYEEADEAGLYALKIGDPIEVKYTDIGWTSATFRGWVGSGNVRYERYGRIRTAAPKFVRIPAKPE